ncbi:clotting factor C-like isoform X4 [Apostichopus japonicus]|uniref:clotting factor C-like isoform X4 n=1 Tax=Stichopus japonicus TaxID=307972 RepID=UPI003AB756B7
MSGTTPKGWIILVLVAFSCLMQHAHTQCTQPEDLPNGEILSRNSDPTRTYRRGYRMRGTCDPSFRMRPESARLTCVGDSWEPAIECVPEDCDLLPPFPRGEIMYRAGEAGVVAHYACTERGYRLHGERRLRCQSDGTWSADSPVCRAMPICEEVEERDHLIRQRINGRRREGLWTYGSRHTFSCEEGYILGSSSTSEGFFYPSIECTRSGWNASIPICRAMPICEEVEERDHLIRQRINGSRREGLWTYGSRHTFSCEEGYILGSSSTSEGFFYPSIECTRSGWNASIPICRAMPICEEVEERDHLIRQRINGSRREGLWTYGSRHTFSCEEGYILGSSTTSEGFFYPSIECTRSGWNASIPICRAMPICEEVEERDHLIRQRINGSRREGLWTYGSRHTFSCEEGYILGSSTTSEGFFYPSIECTRSGWNASIPICRDVPRCPPLLEEIEHGRSTAENRTYAPKEIISYYCEEGYRTTSISWRACSLKNIRHTYSAVWLGVTPRCQGDQDFDDIDEISLKMRENLDMFEASALFEAVVSNETTNNNVDQTARFIPLSHDTGLDLYFMFDGSSSVGEDNFKKTKRFAKELVKEIGVTDRRNSLRVGALVFNSETEIGFHAIAFDSTDDVLDAIDSMQYRGGGTNIAKAFEILSTMMIPQTAMLNRDKSFKTVFLITDGEATEGGDAQEGAREVERQGVTIRCIGISENATRRSLSALASEPLHEHLFFRKDYSTLERLIKIVTNQTIDYSECGVSPRRSINDNLQDTPANLGDWPWQIYIQIESTICGGTLIEANWILTAAHCLHSNLTFDVYAGIVNRFDGSRKKLQVNQTILHPDYDPATKRNDIALIQLRKPVKLSFHIRKACLPDPARENRLLTVGAAVVTGWGHNGLVEAGADRSNLLPEPHLQELTLPLRRREECEVSLVGNDEEDWFDETMTCAGYLGREVGPCSGDSGGPLVKYAKRGNSRRWTVIGVTSWGIGCALQTELHFFANVPHFVPWINENINPEAARLRRNT